MNRTGWTSLNALGSDLRVSEVWLDLDGIWAAMAPGWRVDDLIIIHADSIAGIYDQVARATFDLADSRIRIGEK